ncbi:MAG: hypothetical protein B6D46_15210 [Polyangiaceae bacterium UTPRO1]|jgi:hypothetical protein|nr:FAD-dependent oxidoreductase [Myxococcales bacterium]OQY64804.1 MAG: hypothetical protein B6D46_15210 [Polyangiaceae bacterium UTPRO1]
MRERQYDVVVVGGGMAGIAAGIAAARAGARTLLLERYGFLGGMATAGMVGTICGLYLAGADGGAERLNGGLAGELADAIERLPGSAPPRRCGRTVVVPYLAHELAALADDLVAAERRLDAHLHAHVDGVERDGVRVAAVRFATADGMRSVACSAAVDASGDAVAALAAGAPTETPPPDERQLCSLIFTLQGVDVAALGGAAGLALRRRLAAAEAAALLPAGASDVAWRPTGRPGEVAVKLALRAVGGGAREDFRSAAERAGRRRLRALVDFLRADAPAFAAAFVSQVAPQVGVRESRRIIGRARLTRADVLGGRRFPDAIARAAWPIELWRHGAAGARFEYLADGAWYEIPLACLHAAGVPNLFAAGRCISGTSEALGSARVIGTCLATGAAAGTAAARVAGGAAAAGDAPPAADREPTPAAGATARDESSG